MPQQWQPLKIDQLVRHLDCDPTKSLVTQFQCALRKMRKGNKLDDKPYQRLNPSDSRTRKSTKRNKLLDTTIKNAGNGNFYVSSL